MKKKITVLYVEDNIDERKNQMFVLSARYLNVIEANNGEEGLYLYQKHKPDIIITDIKMPLMNGLKMVEKIREINDNIPILILTGHVDNDYLLQAVNWNNIHFISKDNLSNTFFENSLKKVEKYLGSDNISSVCEVSENIYFDMLNCTLVINNHVIPLTNNEKKLLKLLCQSINQVVTYTTIYAVVWERGQDEKLDSIRSLVRSVNRKLEVKYIVNIPGIGYKIIKE